MLNKKNIHNGYRASVPIRYRAALHPAISYLDSQLRRFWIYVVHVISRRDELGDYHRPVDLSFGVLVGFRGRNI